MAARFMGVAGRLGTLFSYDKRTMRYRDTRNGRWVSAANVKKAVNTVITWAQRDVAAITEDMMSGGITIGAWQRQMAAMLKAIHLGAAGAGKGGFKQLTDADLRLISRKLQSQYRYLERFARQVEAGQVSMRAALARAKMYMGSANTTYEEMRRRQAKNVGKRKERRVLGTAEHCDDCIRYAAMGWRPIGTLPPIGDSQCLTNCKCRFEYK